MIKDDEAQRGIVGRSWKTMDAFVASASQRSRGWQNAVAGNLPIGQVQTPIGN